jgi:hypothetical protein
MMERGTFVARIRLNAYALPNPLAVHYQRRRTGSSADAPERHFRKTQAIHRRV